MYNAANTNVHRPKNKSKIYNDLLLQLHKNKTVELPCIESNMDVIRDGNVLGLHRIII